MDTDLERLQMELSVAYTSFLRMIQQLEPNKRSQSGVSGHWSPKDVVSHLIGWDKSFQEFVANPDKFNPDPLYDTNRFNAQSVSERQHQSWEETIDELQHSYISLKKGITTVTTELKVYGRVCQWLMGRRKDYEFHTNQIEEWIKRNEPTN